MKFAYLRVSSLTQDLSSQQAVMPKDIDRIYEEKISGKAMGNRPELQALLLNVRENDFVWVFAMDRLARSMKDLLFIVESITNKGATLYFQKENLTFSKKEDNFINKFILHILSSFAELEIANSAFRQKIGIELCKARKGFKGKQFKLKSAEVEEMKDLYSSSRITISELAKKYNLSRTSCYRYLNRN